MTCTEARGLLSERLDGVLDEATRVALDAHLDGCAACRGERAALERTVALLREAPAIRAPAGFADRVLAATRPAPWPRRLARRLLVPWPVKVPLQVAALLLVAAGALWVHERAPHQRALEVQQEARRDLAPAAPKASGPERSTTAPGLATPAVRPAPGSLRKMESGPPASPPPPSGGPAPRPPAPAPAKAASPAPPRVPASSSAPPRSGATPPPGPVAAEQAAVPPAPAEQAAPQRQAPPSGPSSTAGTAALAPAAGSAAASRQEPASSGAPSAGARSRAAVALGAAGARADQAGREAAGPAARGRLVVADPEAARRGLEALAARLGGRASPAPPGSGGGGVIDLSVPADRADDLRAGLERLGTWSPEPGAEEAAGEKELRVRVSLQ